MAGKNPETKIRCSFCNKTQDQVRKLIAGPTGVYICDECVDICADILDEELEDVDNTKNVSIVRNAKISALFILFNIARIYNNYYLRLILELEKHLHFTVGLEAGKHA